MSCCGNLKRLKKNIASADYVIVGAGSAGCALAWRLAEAGRDVLIIEHGGGDGSVLINMPAALSYPMNMPKYDWGYRTDAETHWAIGGWLVRAARSSAVLLPSTAWCLCAVIAKIMTAGRLAA